MAFDRIQLAGAVALLLITGGCREEVKVVIVQDTTGATFSVSPFRKSFDACVRDVYVYSQSANGPEREVWHSTNGLSTEPCIKSIRYGEPPASFSRNTPAPALLTGAAYRVALQGSGFIAVGRFQRR